MKEFVLCGQFCKNEERIIAKANKVCQQRADDARSSLLNDVWQQTPMWYYQQLYLELGLEISISIFDLLSTVNWKKNRSQWTIWMKLFTNMKLKGNVVEHEVILDYSNNIPSPRNGSIIASVNGSVQTIQSWA